MQHNELIEREKPVDGDKGCSELGLYMELQMWMEARCRIDSRNEQIKHSVITVR